VRVLLILSPVLVGIIAFLLMAGTAFADNSQAQESDTEGWDDGMVEGAVEEPEERDT